MALIVGARHMERVSKFIYRTLVSPSHPATPLPVGRHTWQMALGFCIVSQPFSSGIGNKWVELVIRDR